MAHTNYTIYILYHSQTITPSLAKLIVSEGKLACHLLSLCNNISQKNTPHREQNLLYLELLQGLPLYQIQCLILICGLAAIVGHVGRLNEQGYSEALVLGD